MSDTLQGAKDSIALVGEIIKAAGNNPKVKEAGGNLGQAAVTLTKTINNVLLPIAAINFAFDKARDYFAEKFQQDLSKKASSIPLAQIVEPKASIAGPVLQGLAFTHEEVPLRDLYLALLATAMDKRVAPDAHPAFVEIIKQLSAEEAVLLQEILPTEVSIPIAQVRVALRTGRRWRGLLNHLLDHVDGTNGAPIDEPRRSAMVDNWVRLGLVEVNYGAEVAGPSSYDWVENRPEFRRLRSQYEDESQTLTYQKGILNRTALGFQFAKATGILAN